MRFVDMKAWVRRRLKDEAKEQFTDDSPIDIALNVGAQQVQREVTRAAPDAFRRIYIRNLEANKYRYQWPRGFLRSKRLAIKYDGANFTQMDPGVEDWIEDGTYAQQGVGGIYAVSGGEIVIYPTPTLSVVEGFKLAYVPTLSMADDDDDLDDLGLVQPLHIAVVLWGVKLLLPEGAEDAREVNAEIKSVLSDIPSYYAGNSTGTEFFGAAGLGKELAE